MFLGFAHWFGTELGYVLGFLVYWLFWCLLAPAVLLDRNGLCSLIRPARLLFNRTNWAAALLWLLVVLVALVMYLPDALDAPYLLLVIAIPVATLNGFLEELLWRGLYLRSFPGAPIVAWVYPAIPFALWHFVPQTVIPAEGGALSIFVSTLFLGLVYGYITWRTMCVIAVVGAAPCQCFSPGANQTTSPGLISSTGPPQRWARPQPAVTTSV